MSRDETLTILFRKLHPNVDYNAIRRAKRAFFRALDQQTEQNPVLARQNAVWAAQKVLRSARPALTVH